MPTVNEKLADKAIRNQVNTLRFTEGQLRSVRRLLREAQIDLERQLFKAGTTFGRSRLTNMLAAVTRQVQEVEKALFGHTSAQLSDFAKQQAGVALTDIESGLKGLGISLTTPNFDLIAKAAISKPIHGKLLKDWWREWGTATRAAVQQQIRLGLVENESIDSIVRRIVGTRANRFTDGVLTVKRRHAEALVRTAVNSVATQAKNDVYEANDDVVEAVEWNSTLDGKTTPICQARDGKMAAIGGRNQGSIPASSRLTPPSARPPAHISCRSTILPVITDWEALGLKNPPESTRASLNGPVSNKLDYEGWLKKQPRSFIEGVLGKGKADLFLKGKLSLGRFVDKSGRAYSLADLKRLNPKAWKVAFSGKGGLKKPVPLTKAAAKSAGTGKAFRGVPATMHTVAGSKVTAKILVEALEAIPGAAAQASMVIRFMDKFKTGSLFATTAETTTTAGYAKIKAKFKDWNKSLGKAHWPNSEGSPGQEVLWFKGKNTWGFTGPRKNYVVTMADGTTGSLEGLNTKGLPGLIQDMIENRQFGTKKAQLPWSMSYMSRYLDKDAHTRTFVTWLHEIGHQVHYRAGFTSTIGGRFYKPMPSFMTRRRLTRYSYTNKQEFHAEHFVAWVLNRKALLKANPELVQYFDELMAGILNG